MKKSIAICFVAICAVLTPATAKKLTETAADQEQARITEERAKLGHELAQQEADCYQRFAVNACLVKVRAANHERTADLRRQEVSLNDSRRRAQGAAQQAKVDERLAQQEAAAAAATASASVGASAPDKASRVGVEQERAELRRKSQQGRKEAHDGEAADRAGMAAEAPINQAAYAEKLKKAADHRAQLEASNRQKAKKRADGLPPPVQPAASTPSVPSKPSS